MRIRPRTLFALAGGATLALALLVSGPSAAAETSTAPTGVTQDRGIGRHVFREPRDRRTLFYGLVAGSFILFCGALGANDRPQGDPLPGTLTRKQVRRHSSAPPGYKKE